MLEGRHDLVHVLATSPKFVIETANGQDSLGRTPKALIDECCDLFGAFGGCFGEFTDFIGDDREPSTIFARSCRFYGRVEGQKIGLLGDAGDDLGDMAHLLGFFTEVLNALPRLFNGLKQRL